MASTCNITANLLMLLICTDFNVKCRDFSVIKKGKRYGYLPSDFETAHSLVESMESNILTAFGTTPTMFYISYYLL